MWGSTSSVDIDRDGKTIWAAERCGANSCLDRATGQIKDMPVIFHFDENGNVIKAFGAGMLIFPHGIYVDKDDNVWVTDGQDNAPLPRGRPGSRRGRGAAPRAGGPSDPGPAPPKATRYSSSARTESCS